MEAAIFLCVNNRLRQQNHVYGEAVCWHPPPPNPDISGSRGAVA